MRPVDADILLEQLDHAALSPASKMIVRMLIDDAATINVGLTKRDCAVITAYTDIAMLKGNDLKYLYDYLSGLAGRPVFTHEIPAVAAAYREQIREDFCEICKNARDGGTNDANM